MRFPFPGIGIAFNIEGLGGGFYGFQAWTLFMKNVDPERLAASILVEGDTNATLHGRANEFCIGIYGPDCDLPYIRETFEALDDPALAEVHRRFIEKIALDQQSLPIRGTIDALGRLVTERWDAIDHQLCRDSGWAYHPKTIPPEVDARVRAELEMLALPRSMQR
jgi:hypothetical protein